MTGRTPPTVGVLHAPGAATELRDLVVAARGLARLMLVIRRSVAETHPYLVSLGRSLAEVAVVGDGTVTAEVADLDLAGLTTFHDEELEHCDAALAALGLPGAGIVTGAWDKLVQRRRFLAAGISRVRAAPVDSAAGLDAAVADVGLPAVLKPRRGTASVGVSFLDDGAALRAQARGRRDWAGLVLEELIPRSAHPANVPYLADYVSVETVSHEDGHAHFAVFDKIPLSISAPSSPLRFAVRETGDILPTRLPFDILAAALACTSRALDALSVRSRVTHTELRVSPSGVEIIEVNGRLGGEVARMARLHGGSDPVSAALELALGRHPTVLPPSGTGYLGCLYVPFLHRGGTVRSDVRPALVRGLPGVAAVDEVARRGDLRSATSFHAVKLLLRAADAAELEHRLGHAVALIAQWFAADGVAAEGWLRDLCRPLAHGRLTTAAAGAGEHR